MGHGVSLASEARYEALGFGTGVGTTITAGASANTKGSYATLGTTSFDYDGLFLNVSIISGTGANRFRLDVAANNGGSDQIIIADHFVENNGIVVGPCVFYPVAVPKGASLKVRSQATTGSRQLYAAISGFQCDENMRRGFRGVASATDWTNTDPTNSITLNGTTMTGWTQVMASTPDRFAGLYFMLDAKGVAITGGNFIFSIGWGSAGNELELTRVLVSNGSTDVNWPFIGPIPCDLPAGTRLAVRAQAAAANTSVIAPVLMGLIA